MPLDLYADELVPESTGRKSGGNGWVGTVVLCLLVVVAGWFYVSHHSKPDVDPSPDPAPSPVVASGLHVLIVDETSDHDKLTPAQVAIFSSSELFDWYETNCAKEDGFRAYRKFDPQDKLDQENQVWRDMRAAVTLEPPCVLAVYGKRAAQFKLPADPDALKATLEKFKAGKK
jgi:hypothetical protein